MSEGILYIADGEAYVREAITSAESVRAQMPDVNVSLATRDDVPSEIFDEVLPLEHDYEGGGQSIITPELIPYDRTVFLDTDTYVAEPIDELFDLLTEFDLCVGWGAGSRKLPEPYDEWPEFNTGVVGFRDCEAVENVFENWRAYHEMQLANTTNDQPAFGKAVMESSARFYVLPRTYNCRLPRIGYVGEDVKIGHGRLDGYTVDLPEAVDRINKKDGTRVYGRKLDRRLRETIAPYGMFDSLTRNPLKTFVMSTREYGLTHGVRAAWREVRNLVGR